MLKTISSLVFLGGIQSCLGYVLSVSLANYLGPEQFGIYSFVLACGALGTLFVNFGTAETGIKLSLERGASVFNSIIAFRILSLGVIAFCSLIYAAIFLDWYFIGVPVVATAALSFALIYEYRAKNIRASMVYSVERLLYTLAILLGIALHLKLSVAAIFCILLVAQLTSLAFQAFDLRIRLHDLSFSQYEAVLRAGLEQFLYQIGKFGFGGGTRIVIFSALGATASGNFAVAWTFIPLATIYYGQIVKVFRLPLTKTWTSRSYREFKRLLSAFFMALVLPAVLAASLFLCVGGEVIALIFSEEYVAAKDLAPYVGLYFIVAAVDAFINIVTVIMDTVQKASYINGGLSVTALLISYLFSTNEASFFLILILTHLLALSITFALSLGILNDRD